MITWSGMFPGELSRIRETANRNAIDQLIRDISLVAALIASHQEHSRFLSYGRKPLTDRVSFHQSEAVVLEKKHSHNFNSVPAFFKLRENHAAKFVRNRMALRGENISDFHREDVFQCGLGRCHSEICS